MRQNVWIASIGGITSLLAALILILHGGQGSSVPVALSFVSFASSLFVIATEFRRRSGENSASVSDGESENEDAAGAAGAVLSLVRAIRDDQSTRLGENAFAEKYPALVGVVNSRDIGEVYANIDSVYAEYELTGKISKELMDKLLVDCLVLLPLANSVLAAVPSMTEEAAFSVIEKFMVVREASADGAEKAKKLREEIADTESEHSVQYTSERTRQAVRKERDAVKALSMTIRENREHLAAMGKEVESGLELLRNIEEITERSKLIAFNMSIEAARLGDSGRGFKVIITELHRLNEKTFDFSRRVAILLGKFREYNNILAENIERKSAEVIAEVERGMDAAESSVESLISASGRTQKFTQDIAAMSESIDRDLDGVLESLQFQDITRQMIEGAQAVLGILKGTLDECMRIDGVSVDARRKKERFEKLRDGLVATAKTKGEKNALLEVTL
jgi:hypothetical protein